MDCKDIRIGSMFNNNSGLIITLILIVLPNSVLLYYQLPEMSQLFLSLLIINISVLSIDIVNNII